jgi:hypothetical protein
MNRRIFQIGARSKSLNEDMSILSCELYTSVLSRNTRERETGG